jgi:hypothetical protein
MTPQQKRLMLLNYLIKRPPRPHTPEAQLIKMWQKELAQLKKDIE